MRQSNLRMIVKYKLWRYASQSISLFWGDKGRKEMKKGREQKRREGKEWERERGDKSPLKLKWLYEHIAIAHFIT